MAHDSFSSAGRVAHSPIWGRPTQALWEGVILELA